MKTLAENIYNFRKKSGLTQEDLADKLNISFQAVSKWENGQTAPDISLLPVIAQIFNVNIDTLFGIKLNINEKTDFLGNWNDDNTIRGIILKGREVLAIHEDLSKFSFNIEGEALNITSNCNVKCVNVEGNVNACNNVACDKVGGNANAGNNIDCNMITGNANAGNNIDSEKIDGSCTAGNDIICKDIA
jgi:transcriptional regulator with XRE-family HTH domain